MKFISKYVLPFLQAHVAGFGSAVAMIMGDAGGNLNNLGKLTLAEWLSAAGVWLGLGLVVQNVTSKPFNPAAPVVVPTVSVAVSQDSGDAPIATPVGPILAMGVIPATPPVDNGGVTVTPNP